jgi:staphyloferrin B biosynthesis citrate synthase
MIFRHLDLAAPRSAEASMSESRVEMSGESGFRAQLRARRHLLGTFIKTPSPHVVEIVGQSGFDFVVIDQEHAPFDRVATDLALLAARALNIPALVRVPAPGAILAALDDGADGVIVPHVPSAAAARAVAVSCRYEGGGRGYSNAPRAGRYGATTLARHVASEDARVAAVVMIEDIQAVAEVDDIVAVEGVDAVFIGCADLAVSLGEASADSPRIRDMAGSICRSAARSGCAVMAPAPTPGQAQWLIELGVTALVVGSDQSMLRGAAEAATEQFRSFRRG